MHKKILLALMMVIIIGVSCISVAGADKLYKIAVLPFDDGSIQERWWGNNWKLGTGVSDELVTALMATKKFRLIEREQINKVLQEQNFGTSGRVDTKSAAKIGKILGVQYLVLGKITEFSFKSQGGGFLGDKGVGLGIKTTTSRVSIDARLVDTTSAEIKASVTGKGEKKNTNLTIVANWNAIAFGSDEFKKTDIGIALRDAIGQLASGLATNAYDGTNMGPVSLTGTVFYAKDNRVIINIGSGEGVQVGMVFVVNHVIELVKDPDTGEVVDEVSEPVAEITVTEVKEKTSTCSVTKKLSNQYPIVVKDSVKQK